MTDLQPAARVCVDQETDERGQVLAFAVMQDGRRVALMLNAN